MSRAYASSGVVIISDDGYRVTYHPHCDKCGYTNVGQTGSSCVSSHISSNIGVFRCPKCGETVYMQINRDF